MRGWLVGIALLFCAGSARAEGSSLSSVEKEKLGHGETVSREQDLTRGERHYVGGVTYTVLDATESEITSLFDDVDAYKKILPKTKQARLLEINGQTRTIELVQGNSMVEATYAINVHRESPREVRFWLDASRSHDIADAWGFFRVEPFQGPNGEAKVLLTYGVLVDVGPGIVRDLFEERVRVALLGVPQSVKRHVADRRSTN